MTLCSVQPFILQEDNIVPGKAYEASTPVLAMRYAESRIDGKNIVGGIAISQVGDPQLGDWEEPVILGVYGEVPEGVFE